METIRKYYSDKQPCVHRVRTTALRAQGQTDSLACTGSEQQPCAHTVRPTALRAHGQNDSLACTRSDRQPCAHTVRTTALRAHRRLCKAQFFKGKGFLGRVEVRVRVSRVRVGLVA